MRKILLIAMSLFIILLSACSGENTKNTSTNDTNNQIEVNDTVKQETLKADISAEFKAAMDSYEAFFDEYVTFMKKYAKSNGKDMNLLNDYTTYMSKYADTMTKFEALKEADMSAAEAAYYIEVQSRITKKLLEVAQ